MRHKSRSRVSRNFSGEREKDFREKQFMHATSRLLRRRESHATALSATSPKYLKIFERTTLDCPCKRRGRCATKTAGSCGMSRWASLWAQSRLLPRADTH